MSQGLNANPIVYKAEKDAELQREVVFDDEDTEDPIDALEVFNMLRNINDPEHPLTLEQLNVATFENIKVDNVKSRVSLTFTPTIPHCSMATLIGLSLRVKLIRSLPARFKVDISITPGTHASELAVNKQLNDKERVAAALENAHLLEVLNRCIGDTDPEIPAALLAL